MPLRLQPSCSPQFQPLPQNRQQPTLTPGHRCRQPYHLAQSHPLRSRHPHPLLRTRPKDRARPLPALPAGPHDKVSPELTPQKSQPNRPEKGQQMLCPSTALEPFLLGFTGEAPRLYLALLTICSVRAAAAGGSTYRPPLTSSQPSLYPRTHAILVLCH